MMMMMVVVVDVVVSKIRTSTSLISLQLYNHSNCVRLNILGVSSTRLQSYINLNSLLYFQEIDSRSQGTESQVPCQVRNPRML